MAMGLKAGCAALGLLAGIACLSTLQAQVREVKVAPVAAAPVGSSAVAVAPAPAMKEQGQLSPPSQEVQLRRLAPPSTEGEIVRTQTRREEAPIRYERITVNKSRTVRSDTAFSDVLVGNSEIAEVVPISDRSIYLLGKKLGTTNVSMFNASKQLLGIIDVTVEEDFRAKARQAEEADAELQERLGESGAGRLRVRRSGQSVVLTGVAQDAPTVDRAVSALRDAGPMVNLTRVAPPQQVMLKVRFVEINRSAGRDFGVRFEYAGRDRAVRSGRVAGQEPLATVGGVNAARGGVGVLTDIVPSVAGAALSTVGAQQFGQILAHVGGGTRQLDVFISALEERGLARRLAEPNLVASSGERAEFLAGGEYPIPVAQTAGALGAAPTITVQYKEFGVKLVFLPTVLANGVISLQLEPEVSEIDPAVSVSVGGGIVVPGLSKRRAKTFVELKDGQSFAIAGLIQNFSQRTVEQLPWLGSLPIIGALFSSKEFLERETELVVIVTPHLVKPAKPGQLMADQCRARFRQMMSTSSSTASLRSSATCTNSIPRTVSQ